MTISSSLGTGRQWFTAGLLLLLASIGTAARDDEFRILYTFDEDPARAAVEGVRTSGPLLQRRDGSFLGATRAGGKHGAGTLFTIDTAGKIRVLHSFATGTHPIGALIETEDGRVYGVTSADGPGAIVYARGVDDRVTSVATFDRYAAGGDPVAGLTEVNDGSFYGVAGSGGDAGSVFRTSPKGDITVVHAFRNNGTEGAGPAGPLIEFADGSFYCAMAAGGTHGAGAIVRISTEGEVDVLHAFDPRTEGGTPTGGLVLGPNGSFFGVLAASAKPYASGAIYRVSASGDFAIVHDFTGADGARPIGELTSINAGTVPGNGWLVGVTRAGGMYGGGTLYRLDTKRGSVAVLHAFGDRDDASSPVAGVIQAADGAVYGTTDGGAGAIYRLRLR